MDAVEIFTDGACSGNPGPGGYGVVMKYKGHEKELSAGFALTTNNRMELLAVIVGLEALKSKDKAVHVYSDSSYVVDAINKGWLQSWIKKGFKGKKNQDLWIRFNKVASQYSLKFIWIKGHAGHPENERCDKLAVSASQKADLPKDLGYQIDSTT